MKPRIPKAWSAAVLALGLCSCEGALRAATSEPVPLAYVGTVELGPPSTRDGVTRVPLTFSGGAWGRDSGRVLRRMDVERRGHAILVTVETCLATDGHAAPEPELVLEDLLPGTYPVLYRNPDGTSVRVGEIAI